MLPKAVVSDCDFKDIGRLRGIYRFRRPHLQYMGDLWYLVCVPWDPSHKKFKQFIHDIFCHRMNGKTSCFLRCKVSNKNYNLSWLNSIIIRIRFLVCIMCALIKLQMKFSLQLWVYSIRTLSGNNQYSGQYDFEKMEEHWNSHLFDWLGYQFVNPSPPKVDVLG